MKFIFEPHVVKSKIYQQKIYRNDIKTAFYRNVPSDTTGLYVVEFHKISILFDVSTTLNSVRVKEIFYTEDKAYININKIIAKITFKDCSIPVKMTFPYKIKRTGLRKI